ncbi:MAG TPA: cytochrome C oxidase subunit IV family protein [Methylomirabilota bacterium]|nr:cytochrome C oxidase subunit IV family protein [Methylomirabilota bacterium]
MAHTHSPEEIKKSVRKYMMVFGALLVGTVITVAASYIHFENFTFTVLLALFIASIKAFLVAGWFMHLISERKMIYFILTATVFFFAGLVYLTLWSMAPDSFIHIRR